MESISNVAYHNDLTQSLVSAQVHRGLKINSPCDNIILILIVGYICQSTITSGSSQHSAVVLFDWYVAASARSRLDDFQISALQMGSLTVFNCRLEQLATPIVICVIFVIAGIFHEIITKKWVDSVYLVTQIKGREET